MDYEIRADGVLHIEGYVNAVERDSRPVICGECGKCVEQIKAGVFDTALRAAKNIDLLLNHNRSRKLGGTAMGNITLKEDNIGLRASADITDPEVIDKAKYGKLRGWSFGFRKLASEIEKRAEALPRRIVTALELFEVSIIDDTHIPCYAGTSIEMRADGGEEEVEVRYEPYRRNAPSPAYYESLDRYMAMLDIRGRAAVCGVNVEIEERYNPYHDPSNGRFTSGGSGGGGEYIFMVPQGAKGKGVLVKDMQFDDKDAANGYYNAVYNNSNVNNGKHRLINGSSQYNTNTTAAGAEGTKFGVNGGAGTAYTLVTVDGENKLVRNDFIYETADGKILISLKSRAASRTGISSGIDYDNSVHSALPDTIGGVSNSGAMSFAQADNGNTNPNYRPHSIYSKNCQSCVPVFEARLRGYDVEAKPKNHAVARELSLDTALAWIDPATGKKPVLKQIKGDYAMGLESTVNSGERYALQYNHRRGGHIVTAFRDERSILRIYDPQTDNMVVGSRDISKYFNDRGAHKVETYRIDNLDFNEDALNGIAKPRKRT